MLVAFPIEIPNTNNIIFNLLIHQFTSYLKLLFDFNVFSKQKYFLLFKILEKQIYSLFYLPSVLRYT